MFSGAIAPGEEAVNAQPSFASHLRSGPRDRLCAGVQTVAMAGVALALWHRFKRASHQITVRRIKMSLGTILLIFLILILVGVIPTWPHSRSWGYGPSGGVGLLVVILVILLLLGRI
jgi:hypothetical protein